MLQAEATASTHSTTPHEEPAAEAGPRAPNGQQLDGTEDDEEVEVELEIHAAIPRSQASSMA